MAKANDIYINDELSNRIESMKVETRGLIKELLSLLCMEDSPLNEKNITLHVKRLSDGVDESDYYFEKKFVSGDIKSLSRYLTFEKLPISENIETYRYPLVLISDENEIDEYVRHRIIRRKEQELKTYPILVFCDDFFTVREGESFGYINIIESIEEACGDNCRAMAFKMSDMKKENKYVKAYIDYLDMALHLKEAKECIDEAFEYIDSVIDRLQLVVNDVNNNDFKKLAAIAKIRNHLIFRESLIVHNRKLDEHIKKVDGLIIEIRNKYDEHIYSIRKREPLKMASSMAVHIDLKYGTLKDQMFAFLMKVSKCSLFECNEVLPRNTVSLVEESFKELNTNASELTLIGTFSSGKTTMINTFLGHNHKLHTSKNHNTAVLMQIKKKPENEAYEFYEVINKEKLKWNLIKPAYLETKLYRNPFPGRARVIGVIRTEQGFIVKLREVSGEKRIQDVRVGKMHRLCINENSVVEGDASLIVMDKSEKELQLASKTEIQFIIEYIAKKKLVHPRVRVSYKGGEREYKDKEAIGFIKRLSKCEKYNQVSKDTRQPMISYENLSELMGGEIILATFLADILDEGKKVRLDEKGWIEFCGVENVSLSSSNTVPFCEAPNCYMIAEHINVYLDCEFLNYCSVNDTPGFGSITEEHDACTERFVSSSKSRLLAMITINSKSEDTKLYDFLNFIANVFQNFRKDQVNEVYFMLNCFSNNAVEEKLHSDIKKISKLIIDLGFNKDNIYVCNLRKATEESQEMLTMWGFPSYAAFRKKCINSMLESGLVARLSWVYDSWKNYFKDNIGFIDERISILEDNLENGENQIEQYKNKINAVKIVRDPSIDGILAEAAVKYDEFYDYIETTFIGSKKRSGFLWRNRERQEACGNIMDQIDSLIASGELEGFVDEIKQAVRKALNELEIASDIYLDDELPEANYTLFTLALQNIREKLLAADENTYWYNKNDQTNYYMGEIKSIIDEDYKKSAERAKKYYENLKQIFVNRKKQALHTLDEESKGIGNPDLIRKQINAHRKTADEIKRLKKVFEKSINTDVLRSR